MPLADYKDYPPLKDLINTYLPNEAIRPIEWMVITCPVCHHQYKGVVGQPTLPCLFCHGKDIFL